MVTGSADIDLILEVLSHARQDQDPSIGGFSRALRERGLSAAEAGPVVDAVHALWVSQARLQRRTKELEALFSTARELVQLHDVDTVLQRLVERAHGLIGTDVAYLSELFPDTSEFRVRYSVGTVSSAFRDLRVPAGVGLASKVAEARAPVWVSHYDAMSEAPHDPRIDAAVHDEGLVAFLGVPLAVGDHVLGALFACNRFTHEFTPDQVLLLSAFADHAAAVLNTARIMREIADVGAGAQAAYRELESHVLAMETASAVHDQLTSTVISGGSVEDVTSILAATLDSPVWVLDESLRPLGGSSSDALPTRRALSDAVDRSLRTGRCETCESGAGRWLVVAIVGTDSVLGAVLARDNGSLPQDTARRTLERAAHIAALVSLKREAARAARWDRRQRALLSVLDADGASREIDDELATLGGPLVACTVLDLSDGRSGRALEIAASYVDTDGLTALRGRYLVVAWTSVEALGAAEQLRELLSAQLRRPVNAVAGRVAGTPGGLRDAVDQAERCLPLLLALGASGVLASADELMPYRAVVSADPGSATRFIDEMLGAVVEWDGRRGTALVDTLIRYFEAGESRTGAATALHLHKNTVQQRLDRVVALAGGDWSDAEWRFRLHTATRLESLRRSMASR